MPFEATIHAFAAALGDPSAAAALDDPRANGRARRAPVRGLPQQCRGRPHRRDRGALSRRRAGSRARSLFRALARAFVHARQAALAGHDRLWRRIFPEFLAGMRWRSTPCLADVARLENAWVEAYHAEDARRRRSASLPRLSPIACPERGSSFTRRRGSCASRRPPPRSGPPRRARTPGRVRAREAARTRSSPVPTATSACASLPAARLRFRAEIARRRDAHRGRSGARRPGLRSSAPISSDWSRPAPSPRSSPDSRHDRRRRARDPPRAVEPRRPRDQRRVRARPRLAAASRPAPRAGAAVLRLGAYALGRLVHALLRREDPVRGRVQAAHSSAPNIRFPRPNWSRRWRARPRSCCRSCSRSVFSPAGRRSAFWS